jgi:hypothetical protein
VKLVILKRKSYTVAAYIKEDGDVIQALDELKGLGAKYSGSAKGVASLFKLYAEHGRLRPYGLTKEQMHHANYDPDIFEFIKGDVRVFCFIDGNMAVLTNSGLKKGQKANKKDVAKAIKIYRQYDEDRALGNIRVQHRE